MAYFAVRAWGRGFHGLAGNGEFPAHPSGVVLVASLASKRDAGSVPTPGRCRALAAGFAFPLIAFAPAQPSFLV